MKNLLKRMEKVNTLIKRYDNGRGILVLALQYYGNMAGTD